jgi:hypothetical protein
MAGGTLRFLRTVVLHGNGSSLIFCENLDAFAMV